MPTVPRRSLTIHLRAVDVLTLVITIELTFLLMDVWHASSLNHFFLFHLLMSSEAFFLSGGGI
jgi:hypothetical protein